MPKNYWMVVQTTDDFEISKAMGFKIHGLKSRFRRRVQRMEPDDLVLFYVEGIRKWTAIAVITSKYFEDSQRIWNFKRKGDEMPYRVNMAPSIVLQEKDYINALELGPRLEYVKRWAPEDWPLAFMDSLHLLPQRDFRLIEGEMKRVTGRSLPPRRTKDDTQSKGRHRGVNRVRKTDQGMDSGK